jgi:hypothetical protein
MKRIKFFRGVAQPGSALGLGPRGRMFESSRPDQSAILGWKKGLPLQLAEMQANIVQSSSIYSQNFGGYIINYG